MTTPQDNQYLLSATLLGHSNDVRAIDILNDQSIVSVLRDTSVKLWQRSEFGFQSRTLFQSPSGSYINAITHIDMGDSDPLVVVAGNDAVIYVLASSDQESTRDPSNQADTSLFQLLGHAGNICSLNYSNRELVLASWDGTAKVWDLDTCSVKYDLIGHQNAVWDALALGNDQYISCSADGTIKLWNKSHVMATFTRHSDVVRKLLILPNRRFASASNDGSIIIWDMDSQSAVQTLLGHLSFVYSLSYLEDGGIVSSGEDRTIRIWRDGVAVQVLTLPCISVWTVACMSNGDIVCGGSDINIRIFTRALERVAPASEIEAFQSVVESSEIAEQSLDELNKSDLPGPDALGNPGTTEGQMLLIKRESGVIEAHQWLVSEWVKIGDVVGQESSSTKKEHMGSMWDYVFDVDVKDGAPTLKLTFNTLENPHTAAQRFIDANELPQLYKEDIVQFIIKNTKSVPLDSVPSQDSNIHAKSIAHVPMKSYMQYTDYNASQLEKGLKKLNSLVKQDVKFSSVEVDRMVSLLRMGNSACSKKLILTCTQHIVLQWPTLAQLIGFDILRATISKLLVSDLVQIELVLVIDNLVTTGLKYIDETSISTFMLILNSLNNMITSVLFIQLYVDPSDDAKTYSFSTNFVNLTQSIIAILKGPLSSVKALENKHFTSCLNSLSTFVYNITVFILLTPQFKSVSPFIPFLNECAPKLVQSDSELAYRVAVAYVNLIHSKNVSLLASWWDIPKEKFGDEERFQNLEKDIQSLLS